MFASYTLHKLHDAKRCAFNDCGEVARSEYRSHSGDVIPACRRHISEHGPMLWLSIADENTDARTKIVRITK